MLRAQTSDGWILITHPDHAQLAGKFAAHWGNSDFVAYAPRTEVLSGISAHDNGWQLRDQQPMRHADGTPSAFGTHLVGAYSAFENIDLADYLAVRARATSVVAEENPYGAILISMHTCNLLTVHADRSTIVPDQLPLLDSFIAWQRAYQEYLRQSLRVQKKVAEEFLTLEALERRFILLQACDNLSLLTCVDYRERIPLQHKHLLLNGETVTIEYQPLGDQTFRLSPYPLDQDELTFSIRGRQIQGKSFASVDELRAAFSSGTEVSLTLRLVR